MTRCGYLDQDGKQCKRLAGALRAMHLNGEIYGSIHDPDVPDTDIRTLSTWVAVAMCKSHGGAFSDLFVMRGNVQDRKVKDK